MTNVKLGKKAARIDPRTLKLTDYLTTTLPAPPPVQDWSGKVPFWPMMLNNDLGDCTCACAGHMIEEWTTYASIGVTPTDASILAAYEAVGGYVPGDPSTDNGAVVLDVLNYWRQTGISGHKIMSYVSVKPKSFNDVKNAIFLFGNVYLGVLLPITAQLQTNFGMWYPVSRWQSNPDAQPGSWGGHAIPAVAYDSRGLTVITWGRKVKMTWGFLSNYCDECYAVLSSDWVNKQGLSPGLFDLAKLEQDLQQL